MVAQVFSFPMRLQSNGRIAVVDQDSDAHIGEELAIVCFSRPGERPLVPDFGIEDPTFEGGIGPESVTSQVTTFEIPAVVRQVHATPTDDTTVDVLISYEGASLDES